MTPQEFIAKWQRTNLSERSAYQQHFLDLCDVLGQPKPAAADPDGAWYTFERGVQKTTGEKGWADVWMRGHFGWEYKGKHKDLAAAYQQPCRVGTAHQLRPIRTTTSARSYWWAVPTLLISGAATVTGRASGGVLPKGEACNENVQTIHHSINWQCWFLCVRFGMWPRDCSSLAHP